MAQEYAMTLTLEVPREGVHSVFKVAVHFVDPTGTLCRVASVALMSTIKPEKWYVNFRVSVKH